MGFKEVVVSEVGCEVIIPSPVCNIHPQITLVRACIEIAAAQTGDLNSLHTLRCSEPSCNSHYTSEHGGALA
jgi:hypothetical protein